MNLERASNRTLKRATLFFCRFFGSFKRVSENSERFCYSPLSDVPVAANLTFVGKARSKPQIPFKIFSLLLLILVCSTSSAMRLVVQRVTSASVTVEGKVISSIGPGLLSLVGIHENDTVEDLQYCCKRLLGCKLWPNADSGGQWRHGVKQRGYKLLCVSQFTLYGTLTKKNQPDYKRSMKAIPAQELYSQFLDMLKEGYEPDKIFDGEFGAMMDVSLVNDGPVTIIIESEPKVPTGNQNDEES